MKRLAPWLAVAVLACSGCGTGEAPEIIIDVMVNPAVPVDEIQRLEVSVATFRGTSLQIFPVIDELDDFHTTISLRPESFQDTLSIGIVATHVLVGIIASGSANGIPVSEGVTSVAVALD